MIALARAGGRTGRGLAYTAAAAGAEADLFVDANGAYSRKQALTLGQALFGEAGISWFEEPVSSDDLEGPTCSKASCVRTPSVRVTG